MILNPLDPDLKQQQFLELYEPAHERLSRFIQSTVWNREDAKDIFSETVLIAYEKFDRLKNREAFLYFLFGIASRLAMRRDRRKKFLDFTGHSAVEVIAEDPCDSPLDVSQLYEALSRLPLKQRETITLFEISGFSLNEIREIQGGSLSGVKSRLVRARDELSRLLKAQVLHEETRKF